MIKKTLTQMQTGSAVQPAKLSASVSTVTPEFSAGLMSMASTKPAVLSIASSKPLQAKPAVKSWESFNDNLSNTVGSITGLLGAGSSFVDSFEGQTITTTSNFGVDKKTGGIMLAVVAVVLFLIFGKKK